MRVYALRDESLCEKKILAYIFYYQKSDEWYIEISDDVESHWELPFILDHFFEQGYKTVDEYWSRKFVEERIIPPDRQNLGAILKNCKLDTYDEFALFEIADGRCAQDDCYIERIAKDALPESIRVRRKRRINTINQIDDTPSFFVTLKDGTVGIIELDKIKKENEYAARILQYYNSMLKLQLVTHGAGISIQGGSSISYEILAANMKKIPISEGILKSYAENEIISTSEAMEILNCSRQNLDDLVKRGKLIPTKIKGKSRMYFRSDVESLR